MIENLPKHRFGLLEQEWEIGDLNKNFFKISLEDEYRTFENLNFEIQCEGEKLEFTMHYIYVDELVEKLSFYSKLMKSKRI